MLYRRNIQKGSNLAHWLLIGAITLAAIWTNVPAAQAAEAAQIGYWALNETSGTTAADASNYGNTGTVTNGTWTAGHTGNALSFNGTTSRVTVPNSTSINTITNRMTVAFWANASNLSAQWVTALQRSNAANDWFDWQLYLRAYDAPTANRPVLRIDWNQSGSIDADEQVQGDVVLAANTWYHIAATYDGTAMRFYIDGTQRGSTAHASSNIPNSNQPIWMGGNSAWGEYFTGRLDEVYLYNRALSQVEIQALMTSAQYTLTTYTVGNGTVTKNPNQAQYASGTVVQLTATPNTGYVFAGWSGDLSGSANPASITMTGDKVVTATFTLPPPAQPLPIQVGDQWRYLKGTAAPPSNWAATGFDDSAWSLGPTGIGYADNDDATVLTDMMNSYVSIYARKAFSVTNPAAVTGLVLQIDYDDGFVAYLNGTEVARRGLTGNPPAYNTLATSHEASGGDSSPQPVEYISISTAPLVAGVNVLGFQVHNTTLASTDLSFIPALYVPQQYTLTVNTVGSGSVALNPAGGVYAQGTVVTLTATPGTNYIFSGWSGDLSGSANPATLTMNANKTVTATFMMPTPMNGICEGFETGYTLGQTIGTHADWYDAGAGPAVNAGVGVTSSNGLAAATDIFTWVAHPFSWTDPDLTVANFQMDFKTDASGQFDDDRIGWMITNTSAASSEFFGIQLDHPDGGIVTYWRNSADTRIQTPIVPLTETTATKANTWYRFQAQIAKLTSTSARIDVTLTELDAAGDPTGTPVTGSVADTSLWSGGAPATRYFTASTMWPAYKNYTTAASNADNACFSQVERFAFVVTTDWHTSDSWPNATVADNLQQIRDWIVTPTLDMPAPAFMVVTGDFPNWDQTQASIDNVLGTGSLWYPVIGNHDVEDNINNFNYVRDTMVPALPNIVNYGPTGSINTSYSWNYGNAHFVSLNAYWDGTTNSGADHAADGNIVPALNTWIDADLTASGQTHNFAFVHEPAFPANRHVGDSLDQYPANRDAFIATLNTHDVETVFSGHTHFYEHDVAPEFPLGNLHQVTNGYLRAYDGATITYVLVNGDCTTYKVYRRLTSAPFTLHETWSIGCSTPAQYTLTTNVAGNGTVTKNPDQAQYTSGSVVQLTATPNTGYVFSGWSGDLTGSTNPATIAMNSNKVVTATFVTAPPPGVVTRFAAVGDYGIDNANEQSVANLISSLGSDFIVTTGDNSYTSNSIDNNIGKYFHDYIGNYTGSYGAGSAVNRFFPSIGNHDYSDGGGMTAYLNYFTLPGAGITTTNTSGNERYYDFVQGPVHFFAIDSDTNEPNGTSSSSTQAQWLQTQLAASTAPWKIVYFHHPPYTSGTTHANATWMQWPFQAWGATAVLNGHNHHYERILKNDFPYFITGAGGNGLYSFNATPESGSVVRYNANYGTMLIEASSITMTFKFYSITGGGTLIDSYTITSTAPTDNNLMPAGSTWKYLDNGSDQGTAWRASAFNDTSWASGAAPLGYGDPMTTTVNCGPSNPTCTSNNYITTYFRRAFNVTDPAAYSDMTLALRRDDGAVVYLNGNEAWRSNMSAGTVNYTTLAPVAVGGTDETRFFTTTLANTLVAGTNVLAVEIHQQAATSTDIGFDVILTGTLAGPTQYNLTVNTSGSGSVTLNPSGTSYSAGTVVTLTAAPGSGYVFSGWSGDLSGSLNPTTITINSNKVVTATFVPGACTPFTENFNGLTLGTRIGLVPGWSDNGSAGPSVVASGLASTQGLGTGSSIFNWSAHPFTWTNPALTSVTFQMDFQANGSGAFDDDRLAWMTENTPGSSQYNFGIQLDTDDDGTACPTGQNIETYWRNPAFSTTRVETTITCLPALTANGWYRAQLVVSKLTNTSARFDVTLTALDASGNPGAVMASGTVTDTSIWPGGAAPAEYFSPSGASTALYPSYKNHNGTIGNADNAYADLCSVPTTQYTLTVNTTGGGTVAKNPDQAQYAAGTVVTLTATPDAGYTFSGWSGDLTGSVNPTTITMNSNRVVTATFVPGACVPFTENVNSLTLGTRIGQVPGWTESASASPAVVAGGLAGTQGLGTGSSIFNWSAHPFTWTNPALNSVTFQMDFQTNASGTFDDDRLAWMTENTPASSQYNFGIQLDPDTDGTACPSGQNIETYWRNPAFSTTSRVETTIACLPALIANGWYRAQLLVTKLTNTSARLDVTLTALDGSGNPGAVVASGTVTDTSTWPGGAAPAEYFSPSGTSTALYPSYKNHNGTTGNADNAYADLCPVPTTQYTLTVNTAGSGTVAKNPNAAQYAAGTVVTLTATANAGYVFGGWSGDLSGSVNPTTITMSSNKAVTATFLAEITRSLGIDWNLVSWPVLPSNTALDQVLGTQLHGSDSPETADQVLVWNGAAQSYDSAWYCGGPVCESWGEPWANHWLANDYSSSPLTLAPDTGFWIQHQSGVTETLVVTGYVASDARLVAVGTGWQLLGSVFQAAKPLDSANLPAVGTDSPETADQILVWNAATQSYDSAWYCGGLICESWGEPWANHWLANDYSPTDIVLQPGQGFWFLNRHSATTWTNTP